MQSLGDKFEKVQSYTNRETTVHIIRECTVDSVLVSGWGSYDMRVKNEGPHWG